MDSTWNKDISGVEYHYNNEFSPLHRIEQIDNEVPA